MNRDELDQVIGQGEGVTVEFKKTTGPHDEGLKTACAMLNGRGGFVLFGVSDKGVVLGLQVGAHTLENLVNAFRKFEPPAFPDVETVEVAPGLFVIALRVPGGGGPYTYDGRPYLRNSRVTNQMPQSVYEQKLLARTHPMRRWELQPAAGVTAADLDPSEVTRTVEEAIRRGRMDEPGTRALDPLLTGLGLIRDGVLLNAAVPLFARADRLPLYYPQCLLKLARFKGRDKSEFIDNRQEYGTPSIYSCVPSGFCGTICRSPAGCCRTCSSAKTTRCTRRPPCGKPSPTPSATGTTRPAAGRSAWRFTPTGWRSAASACCRSARRPPS